MTDSSRQKSFLQICGVAVVYFVVARASLFLQFGNSNASPVWPPSGIALTALIIFGRKAWPGIFAGAFAANIVTFLSNNAADATPAIITSFFIACGNSLEAIAGNYLLKNKNVILEISHSKVGPIEDSSFFHKVNNVFWFL